MACPFFSLCDQWMKVQRQSAIRRVHEDGEQSLAADGEDAAAEGWRYASNRLGRYFVSWYKKAGS